MKTKIGLLFFAVLLAGCSALPTPSSDSTKEIGPVYISSIDLLIAESYPVQVSLQVSGDLPTPCYRLQYSYEIDVTVDPHRVDVNISSETDTAHSCVQMLEPFDEVIPIDMAGAVDGTYSVYANGAFVGEFSYPA